MSIIECERRILKDVQIGENLSSWDLREKVKKMYAKENEQQTHVYAETLIKNIRKFRQTGEFYFICVDHHRSIYQRVS